eukprot:14336660-Heterocapsa_arctica.AAC.1
MLRTREDSFQDRVQDNACGSTLPAPGTDLLGRVVNNFCPPMKQVASNRRGAGSRNTWPCVRVTAKCLSQAPPTFLKVWEIRTDE